jgi:hypothetical protein
VLACGGLVDDLANSPDISNGKEEFERCEMAFRQTCWLAKRFWPEVDGMGEAAGGDDVSASRRAAQKMHLQGAAVAASAAAAVGGAVARGDENGDGGDGEAGTGSPFGSVMNGGQDMASGA